MRVLIVGFGSIGKRHFNILRTFKNITSIDLVTKQNIADTKSFKSLREIEDLDVYDYFIIASETSKHYGELKYICSKVSEKTVLVEKPLYDKDHEDIKTSNKIFTAYNLRFHPVMDRLRNLLKDDDVYYANVICGQYLPTWRPNQDYRSSYSADIKKGGGVLRDLSHEIDYICFLFGDIEKIDSINAKISDLEINSDDIFTAIAITEKKVIVNLTIDYISKTAMRRLIIHTRDKTIEVDMIKNTIHTYDKLSSVKVVDTQQIDSNYTYEKMHESMLKKDFETACSFQEGEKVVKIIENIEFKEL